jgi:hypothetical protein
MSYLIAFAVLTALVLLVFRALTAPSEKPQGLPAHVVAPADAVGGGARQATSL